MHDDVWKAAGFDATEHQEFPPGVSDEFAVARIREIFADDLAGHEVLTNNSKWLNFHTVRNESWHTGNLVLLGDAAHTAHFSIGSGTKLAMEDALALAACLHEHPTIEQALTAYQEERKRWSSPPSAPRRPRWSGSSGIGMYADQDPTEFVFNLLTRSRRITFENLRERDAEFAGQVEAAFAAGTATASRPRRCSSRCASATSSWSTGSCSRRWTCTWPRRACRVSSTWCTWAARPSAVPAWSGPR